MIITCPACRSQFRLPDGALGANGRKLRCSACRHVWFAAPDTAELEPADAPPAESPPADVPVAPPPPETIRPPATEPVAETAAEPEPPREQAPAGESGEATEDAREPENVPDAEAAPPPAEEIAPPPVEPAAPAEEPATTPRSVGPTQWEPGAVMPRGATRRDAPAEPSRSGLRLVQPEKPIEPATPEPVEPVEPKPEPAAVQASARPSFDVTRVVAPDAAPAERKRERPRRRGAGLLLVLLILIGIAGFAYFERTTVMRYLPQTAPYYAQAGLIGAPGSSGLKLQDVSYRVETIEGETRLVVTGAVVNAGQEYRLLPLLQAELLNAAEETTLIWTFDTFAEGLAPGATTLFETTYRDPPRTGEDEYVFVTFADTM